MNERWIVTKGGGEPRKSGGRMRLAGTGERLRKERRQQLERDLAATRGERIERAARGEFGVRAADGSKVERLKSARPSVPVASGAAIITDPPLRRTSKQLVGQGQAGERVEYAKDIVGGPVVVNGKRIARADAPSGGQFGADVRPL